MNSNSISTRSRYCFHYKEKWHDDARNINSNRMFEMSTGCLPDGYLIHL